MTAMNHPRILEPKDESVTTGIPLGYVDWDSSSASNEQVIMRSPIGNRDLIVRDQYVRIEDPAGVRTGFLGRIIAGPFYAHRGGNTNAFHAALGKGLSGEVAIWAEIELQAEMADGRLRAMKSRPVSRAAIHALTNEEVGDLLGVSGDRSEER